MLDELDEVIEMGAKPTLYVKVSGEKSAKVMSSFEILKMQIMQKA